MEVKKEDKYFRVLNQFIDNETKLGSSAFSVFVCLLRYAENGSGKCFPGEQRIAKTIGISRVTVSRAIKKLEKLSYFKKIYKRGEHNTYFISSIKMIPLTKSINEGSIKMIPGSIKMNKKQYQNDTITTLSEQRLNNNTKNISLLKTPKKSITDEEMSKTTDEALNAIKKNNYLLRASGEVKEATNSPPILKEKYQYYHKNRFSET